MRQRHLAERENQIGCATCFVTEAIGWPHGKKQVLRSTVLLVAQQVGKFF